MLSVVSTGTDDKLAVLTGPPSGQALLTVLLQLVSRDL